VYFSETKIPTAEEPAEEMVVQMQRPEAESRHASASSQPDQVQASPSLTSKERLLSSDHVFLSSEGTECFMSATHVLSSPSPLAHMDKNDATALSQEAMQVLLNSFTNLEVNDIDDQSRPKTSDLFYLPDELAANSLARRKQGCMHVRKHAYEMQRSTMF
jgi:hypothetical protein